MSHDPRTSQDASFPESLFRAALRNASPYVVGGAETFHTKLNQNESPFDLPEDVKHDLARRFVELPLNRYPSEQPGDLVRALASYAGVDPTCVLATHGSNEFVHSLCLATVEAGRSVALPRPMFSLFRNTVALFGGTAIDVPSRANFEYDVAALAAAAGRSHLTIVACPNNPTGKDLTLEEIEHVASATSGMVLVDEAYVEFTDRRSAVTLIDRLPNVVVMRTLSKAFGLAAMRIGYVVGSPAVIREFLKVRLPFMVDPFAETVAVAAVGDVESMRARVQTILTEKAALEAAVAEIDGVEVVRSATNFFLFQTPRDSESLRVELAESGVVVRSMGGYPELRGFLRVNAGTAVENQRFLGALKSALGVEAH